MFAILFMLFNFNTGGFKDLKAFFVFILIDDFGIIGQDFCVF